MNFVRWPKIITPLLYNFYRIILPSVFLLMLPNPGPAAATQKPFKEASLVERTLCFILDASNQEVWGGQRPVQCLTASWLSGGMSFNRLREGATCINMSALIVILKLVISGLTSVIVLILGTVNLQFQHQFVSSSLRPVLRIVAAYVMTTVWTSGS